MRKLVITSLKGGSGKSTLAANLAVEAEKTGAGPVSLVDTDYPQGSLSYWWNEREAESPLFASTLDVAGVALFVMDTAPQIPPVEMVRQADLVVIPVRPSPNDLRAVGATLQVVEAEHKPFCFVINAIKYNTRIATNTLQVLAQHGRVAPVMIGDSVNLSESMISGQVASEYAPGCKSAAEMMQLWKYVYTLLNK